MEVAAFLKGILVGFSIAAPVGPIAVLCIGRTLNAGVRAGVLSGLGTAAADSVYGLIAALGLTAVSSFFLAHGFLLRFCGSLLLLPMGYRIFHAGSASEPAAVLTASRWGNFGSAFFLTLTNPLTILSFTAVFAGLGIGNTPDSFGPALSIVGGIFSGSLLWWIFLSGTVGLLRSRFDAQKLVIMNKLSGAVIVGLGVAGIVSLWP